MESYQEHDIMDVHNDYVSGLVPDRPPDQRSTREIKSSIDIIIYHILRKASQ